MAAPRRSRAGSACCCIHFRSGLLPCDGMIGVAGSIVEPAWACCATNGLRSHSRRPRLPSHKAGKSFFPVRSAPIIACRGKNAWRAMPVPLPLTDPPSSSSASQKSSPLSSVCRRRQEVLAASGRPLLGQVHLSEWHLLAFVPGFPFVPLICRSFRSKFCCFGQPTGALRPVLCVLSFEDTTQGSFHLVAQFVGMREIAKTGSLPKPTMTVHRWQIERAADKATYEARVEGDLVGSQPSLHQKVSLWGHYRKGLLIVNRGYNHDTKAEIRVHRPVAVWLSRVAVVALPLLILAV